MNRKRRGLYLTEANTFFPLPVAMLFHGLPGGDIHGVMEEMERRGKSDSAAISSAIDMGERETVGDNTLQNGKVLQFPFSYTRNNHESKKLSTE